MPQGYNIMRITRAIGLLRTLRLPHSKSLVSLEDKTAIAEAPSASSSGCNCSQKRCSSESEGCRNSWQLKLKILLFGSTALSFGLSGDVVLADNISSDVAINYGQGDDYVVGLNKIEDGSVISNTHTIKWRIFTDNGRGLFSKGELDEAEKYFHSALQEAKEGFGPRDPHVASSCNNLAEIYRIRKAFDKAEPLYLQAINILEEYFGSNDIRVGAALHNLGQFYYVQRKVELAQMCYERALKIEGRVLGHGHPDFANTMYHLAVVLFLQGKEKDSEALLWESIKISEENGLGETISCIRRMQYLAKILLKSGRLVEAENLHRRILHLLEISKGWYSLETINTAGGLAMILVSLENLEEAQELLERCLDARKNVLPQGDIQVAIDMLHLGKIALIKFNNLRQLKISDANGELEKAKLLADNSIRITKAYVSTAVKSQERAQDSRPPKDSAKDLKFALISLLQSLDFLGLLKATRRALVETETEDLVAFQFEVEEALHQCISIFQEYATRTLLSFPEVKEYLSCLNRLLNLALEQTEDGDGKPKALQELIDEAQQIRYEAVSSTERALNQRPLI